MIQTCKCGEKFLTEADPYVVLPKPSGVELNCGCYFIKYPKGMVESEEQKEVKELIDKILNLRGLIYEKNPQYFDEWIGEFLHSPLICLERMYQFLEENL